MRELSGVVTNRFAFSDGDQRIDEGVEKCDDDHGSGHAAAVVVVAEGVSDECACSEDGERWIVREDG